MENSRFLRLVKITEKKTIPGEKKGKAVKVIFC